VVRIGYVYVFFFIYWRSGSGLGRREEGKERKNLREGKRVIFTGDFYRL